MERKLRVPPIANAEKAVELYYTTTQLKANDLVVIFGATQGTARQLMSKTRTVVAAAGVPLWYRGAVSTVAAYDAWGIDVKTLERGLQRLADLRAKGAVT